MIGQAVVLINTVAGSGEKDDLATRVAELFQAHGLPVRVALSHTGPELAAMTRDALRERPATIIAGGGDGTINTVASALVGTDVMLGVLPLGTLNHFARDLHIPFELEEAVKNIVAGHNIRVDVGEVNDRIFLNNSSLGLYPRVVQHRQQQQQRLGRGKWLAFVWAVITVLRRHSFLRVRLLVNAKEITRRTSFVFVGNNEYEMAGMNIGRRVRLNAGQLSLYLPRRSGRLAMLALGLRGLFGGLRKGKDLDALCAPEILVQPHQKRLRVATDGEVTLMGAPLRYRVRPGALRVIVPRRDATEKDLS